MLPAVTVAHWFDVGWLSFQIPAGIMLSRTTSVLLT